MEDPAQTPAKTGPNGSGSAPNRPAPKAQCVLLCASAPPSDLTRALQHKGVDTVIAPSPEVALAMLVRAHRDARKSTAQGPILLVGVEPDTLGPAGHHLLRCARLYAPHAVWWRFDQHRTPQLSAWKLPAPKPVVVPTIPPAKADPPQAPRPKAEPRLRLVGEQSFRAPPPPASAPFFAGPGIPLAPGTRRPSPGPQAPESTPDAESDPPPPPVSDAEMKMLLSGHPKTDPGTPRRS